GRLLRATWAYRRALKTIAAAFGNSSGPSPLNRTVALRQQLKLGLDWPCEFSINGMTFPLLVIFFIIRVIALMAGAGGDIRHVPFFNTHNEAAIAVLTPDMRIANAAVTSDMVF